MLVETDGCRSGRSVQEKRKERRKQGRKAFPHPLQGKREWGWREEREEEFLKLVEG